jgi:protoporphyrinogen oxidase
VGEIAVVGGGVLGLTLGLRLARRGHRVRVFESAPRVGGLAVADPIGSWQWDRFYHVILQSDTALTALLGEIGLGDRLRWGTTRTGFYADGRWISMSSALEFLRFPLLSLIDKARLAATILHASRIGDPLPLEDVTALEWLSKWSGPRTTERIWGPLLRSKLGEHASEASAAFIWAIIARMYAARRTGLKREMLGYVEGGYDTILRALRAHVERAGVAVVTGARVMQACDDGDTAELTFEGGQSTSFDSVVLTVPCAQVAALCPQLAAAERERLSRVVYQGVICPSFLLRRPLRGFYVTNITDAAIPFTGVIETTALVDRAAFGGHSLVYLPRYLSQQDPLWQRDPAEIGREFFRVLCAMVPELSPDDIVASRVASAREVLAVSTVGYTRDALPSLRTSLARVFIANSAQIAHGTLNVNETITLADRQAEALGALLRVAPECVAT